MCKTSNPRRIAVGLAIMACAVSAASAMALAGGDAAPSVAENEASMATMMAAMSATPSGDVDRDFVTMMMPHHQGAIDMAKTELRYGKDQQLRRLAQEIIVEQTQEIALMSAALRELPAASTLARHLSRMPPSWICRSRTALTPK